MSGLAAGKIDFDRMKAGASPEFSGRRIRVILDDFAWGMAP